MAKPDRIRELQEELYSRNTTDSPLMREHNLTKQEYDVKENFEGDVIPEPTFDDDMEKQHRISIPTLLLAFSLVFFLLAGVYAGYSFFRGSNTVSSNNIDVGVSGPVSIPGGEPLSLDVSILNRNRVSLVAPTLIINYPNGTRRADDSSKELTNERIELAEIKSGAIVRKTINATLFGEEKSDATIKMSLEYRIPNSNAIFSKDISYDIILGSNPISLTVDADKETTSGQEFPLTIHVHSNSTEVLKNVLLQVQYPAGFQFVSGSPPPLKDNATWNLGDIAPASDRTIVLRGKLTGEDQESRVFRVNAGLAKSADSSQITNPFAGFKQEIAIKKPFIGMSVAVNGDSGNSDVVAPRSAPIKVDVTYINNLTVPVSDAVITLNLSGLGLDKNAVKTDSGFYQSLTNVVRWDKSMVSGLAELAPGDSGKVTLSLTPLQNSLIQNPEIILTGSVSGNRPAENNVPTNIVATITRHIKLQSDATLQASASHSSGVINNTGPIPPRAEKETTYTITWSITNGSNDLTDATIKAELPSYVRYLGSVTPNSEDVSYNESNQTITWNAGVVRSGSGYSRAVKAVSFKVALTPSKSQIGTRPVLVGRASGTANDRFTNTSVSLQSSEATTETGDRDGGVLGGTVTQ